MRKVTDVTVTYDDGTSETFSGPGIMRWTHTFKIVESWPKDEPERTKAKPTEVPVSYISINMPLPVEVPA